MQPGATVQPGAQSPQQPAAQPAPPQPPAPEAPEQQPPQSEPSPWRFTGNGQVLAPDPGMGPDNSLPAHPKVNPIRWEASEFIAHEKTAGWYMVLVAGTLVFMGLVYLLTRDEISTLMIAVVALFFGIFAARKPRVLNYGLDDSGLIIDTKFYAYNDFRSFSVMSEGGLNSITLTPMKRFMPLITIYYPPEHEKEIVDTLIVFLPRENREHALIDKLMSKVHF